MITSLQPPDCRRTPSRSLRQRYLAKNKRGIVVESSADMFHRVARDIASAEPIARRRSLARRFYEVMASLTFTDVIKLGGTRRGTNMGILRVDHPDILDFIALKQQLGEMTNFNFSVGLTDRFMQAVKRNRSYPLINPRNAKPVRSLPATMIFDRLVAAA